MSSQDDEFEQQAPGLATSSVQRRRGLGVAGVVMAMAETLPSAPLRPPRKGCTKVLRAPFGMLY